MEAFSGRIYVVDDDAAFLRAVVRLIRVGGYDPVGLGSIDALLGHLPFPARSCVLADILLDGETGLDIPERLAAAGAAVPVLFMSATDDEAILAAANGGSGTPDCLRKPIEARQLLDALETALRSTAPTVRTKDSGTP